MFNCFLKLAKLKIKKDGLINTIDTEFELVKRLYYNYVNYGIDYLLKYISNVYKDICPISLWDRIIDCDDNNPIKPKKR